MQMNLASYVSGVLVLDKAFLSDTREDHQLRLCILHSRLMCHAVPIIFVLKQDNRKICVYMYFIILVY